jgi:hypothetical protein
MRKTIAILSFAILSVTAHAAGIEFEYGHEKSGPGNIRVPQDYVVVTPYTNVGDFEVGLKLEADRDNIVKSNLENKMELQVQHSIVSLGQFKTAGQIGLGRDFTQQGSDFNYYQGTLKPKIAITDKLNLVTSYRYRNSFNTINNFKSNTAKVGLAYEVNKNYEVGFNYGKKFRGSEQGHFLEGGINYSF